MFVVSTASKARRELIRNLGIKHRVTSVDIDETPIRGENIKPYVLRLAKAKALATPAKNEDEIIISVDTAIGLGNKIIGKATNKKHAIQILKRLSGRTHRVVSAIAVKKGFKIKTEVTTTFVTFSTLSSEMINWYIKTGEWRGKAGAYAIQGHGAALVAHVDGCFTNVIGVSVPVLLKMLD